MMTSKQLTFQFTGGGLTSSREDSPASRSALQAKEEARMITATSGRRCCEQFAKYNRVGLWAKMFSELLIGRTEWYSSRCNLIWRLRATKFSRFLFRLVPLMRRTEEIACGLSPENGMLPTVVTQGLKYCNEKGQSAFVPPMLLQHQMIEWEKGTSTFNPKSQNGKGLTVYAKNGLLPTPRSQGEECYKTRAERKGHECAMSYLESNIQYQTGSDSLLNPLFVAEMMGFPPDWTLAPFLDGNNLTEGGE